jgi:hypothetical protein
MREMRKNVLMKTVITKVFNVLQWMNGTGGRDGGMDVTFWKITYDLHCCLLDAV